MCVYRGTYTRESPARGAPAPWARAGADVYTHIRVHICIYKHAHVDTCESSAGGAPASRTCVRRLARSKHTIKILSVSDLKRNRNQSKQVCIPPETLTASGAQGLDWEWLKRAAV